MKLSSLFCFASLLLISISSSGCQQSPLADVLKFGATPAHAQEVGVPGGAARTWVGWKFDLNKALSPTAPSYLGVTGSKLYRDSGPPLDFGWDQAVGEFQRVGPSDLLCDGHFHQVPRIFRADLPAPGLYRVKIFMGDETSGHDLMRISAEGMPKADNISVIGREFAERNFSVDVQDGTLELEFSDAGGNNLDWVVNSIQIYSATGPELVLTAPAPTLMADGSSLDKIVGTGASPGTILTVTIDRGLLLTADVDPRWPGTQIAADARGAFEFKVQRPAVPGTSRVTVSEIAGTQFGETTIAYTAPPPAAVQVFPRGGRFATPVIAPPAASVKPTNPFESDPEQPAR